ncbi:hypothetical protein BC834DRAFT_905912 [Gloeopeniophorella convolvens]|nr:hypothetical protein BC834DRAFT_905912 [Gloeopeniophorella convolvens]
MSRREGLAHVVSRFRYVSCQLDTLCECPISKIRSTLKSLPTTLHATYEARLERISEEKWDHVHWLFQCLSVSTRPLRVPELGEVLAVSLDEEIPAYHNDWRSNDSEIPRRRKTRRVVQFTHFSVKKFLISDQLTHSKANISRFHILPGPSHAVLAKTYLGILLRPNDAAAVGRITSIDRPHLNYYATHFRDEHALFEDPYFTAWAHSGRELGPHQPGAPLYFAALCGLPSIV